MPRPVLYAVGCGGYPAESMPQLVATAQGQGWTVCVIGTRMGMRFLDAESLQASTGFPVRWDYKQPHKPDLLPPADAFVVAPCTFNTTNKLAAGISDTLALGLLNEAIGAGKPVVLAPWPNYELARHPAFPKALEVLTGAGVLLALDPGRLPAPASGRGGAVTFPWPAVHARLEAVLSQLNGGRT